MSNHQKLNCEFLLTPGNKKELAEFAQFLKSEAAPAKLILQNGEETIISESIYQLLQKICQAMESGQSVSLSPPDNFVTTHNAAKIIKVSHANLLQLIESGKISGVKVNSELKIALTDLMSYKKQQDEEREKLLDEIMEISQEAGFYE
jgi:hypothetical protein